MKNKEHLTFPPRLSGRGISPPSAPIGAEGGEGLERIKKIQSNKEPYRNYRGIKKAPSAIFILLY